MHTETGEPFYLNGPIDVCGVALETLLSAALYKDSQYPTPMLYRKSHWSFILEFPLCV